MKKEPSSKASLRDVAKAAGVSQATASLVLRNHFGPSEKTRQRVFAVAREMGYIPDARLAAWMTMVQDASAKDLVPIAWLDTNWEKDSWETYRFLSPYLEGARARALSFGYRIEIIWAHQPGMTMRRISKIVYQRGIEGVIVTHGARHLRLNWDKLASVTLEGTVLAPRLHRVMTDYTFNLLLALKMLKRYGYRRIGICLEWYVGHGSYNTCLAAAHYFQATLPQAEIVPLLYYVRDKDANRGEIQRDIASWLRQHRPDVVVGHDGFLMEMVQWAGLRVPEDIGVVHIATDDDVSDWAGVDSKRRETGAFAAEWVISLLQNRKFGVPENALTTIIRGTWHNGCTLLVPKPK